ncbi:MAG TPA: nuclear transport factor 2 family protein, partial [Solirubrobacter sp.]|nr:nuclear transport factor 2 family protein [Solirubrobacter sp.]
MARRPSRRRITLATLAFAGAAVAFAIATTGLAASDAGRTRSSDADRLRALERTRLEALVDADTTTAGSLTADEFQLINPGGGALGRDDYLGAVRAGAIDYLAFEPTSAIAVRLSGDAATLRYQVNFDLRVGGTRLAHQGWITELYERRRGRW